MTSSPPRPLITMRSLFASKPVIVHVGAAQARHGDHAVVVA